MRTGDRFPKDPPPPGVKICVLRSAAYLISLFALARPAGATEKISYAREILPILSDKCFFCHGPDKQKREEDLRLDIRAEAMVSRYS